MKRSNIVLLLVISIAVICTVALVVYFVNDGNKATIEDFYGAWMAKETSQNQSMQDILYYHWSFFENKSMNFVIQQQNGSSNKTIVALLFQYSIKDNVLLFESPKGPPLEFTFSFSEDKKQLIVTSDEGVPLTFDKVQIFN